MVTNMTAGDSSLRQREKRTIQLTTVIHDGLVGGLQGGTPSKLVDQWVQVVD